MMSGQCFYMDVNTGPKIAKLGKKGPKRGYENMLNTHVQRKVMIIWDVLELDLLWKEANYQ